ncbi:MAG TPA: mandelate racemase/muconate lactonizing enzyme family protein [Candidatus Didemnitutus sp.]|nr:mandelate racemase/muconate lactonizing enzyme family protein [Candidatus Didemnitutus sp.]
MNLSRRDWLKLSGTAAVAAALPRSLAAAAESSVAPYLRDAEQAMFNLPGQFTSPVKIASIEMLKNGNNYFVRTRSTDGATGITGTKQVEDFLPIFEHLVAPHFIGQDARDLESLIDVVYRENYKLAGLAFWAPVAYAEQSILDLLGEVAQKPVGALLGGRIREEIPIYLSGSDRILSAEEEVEVYVRGVAETGAKAVKFKIGGRMSRNLDTYPGRTETVLRLGRQKLGDKIILRADANGSYDVPNGIRIGRLMEELGYDFFEEPCPWEELSETQAVAAGLKIPIAYGEQNSSLWQFDWMLRNGVMKIVQPDINYNGGLIRAKRVARIAAKHGATIVPHNTQTGATSVNIVQFASCTPNATPFMEYPWRKPQTPPTWYKPDFKIADGKLKVPTTPGMGLEIDPDYLTAATVIAKIDKPARGGSTGSGSGG